MEKFTTRLLKFEKNGEKTGWTFIEIPNDIAQRLHPGNKKMFRVKGALDQHRISQVVLFPAGNGSFIMPVNNTMRKGIGKREGAMLDVSLEIDTHETELDKDLLLCLEEEPEAKQYFFELTKSHRNYFSKWIEGAKTEATKAKRIANTLNALVNNQNFGEMMRSLREK